MRGLHCLTFACTDEKLHHSRSSIYFAAIPSATNSIRLIDVVHQRRRRQRQATDSLPVPFSRRSPYFGWPLGWVGGWVGVTDTAAACYGRRTPILDGQSFGSDVLRHGSRIRCDCATATTRSGQNNVTPIQRYIMARFCLR